MGNNFKKSIDTIQLWHYIIITYYTNRFIKIKGEIYGRH